MASVTASDLSTLKTHFMPTFFETFYSLGYTAGSWLARPLVYVLRYLPLDKVS